ncbi:Dabb family protein [soil metagenome]
MIQHTVSFRPNEGADVDTLLARAADLAAIDGVRDFTILNQVGHKADYTHALSMYFATQDDYDTYNAHPDHVAFVNDVWIPTVADFIELDYVAAFPGHAGRV